LVGWLVGWWSVGGRGMVIHGGSVIEIVEIG
jgi:hypothetical protein